MISEVDMNNENEVKVGVGVIIVRNGCLLLGERYGSHGAGTWALPGGHLEFGETVENCAKREVLEETGLSVTGVREVAFTNDMFEKEREHYVTLFVMADQWSGGEPAVLEPNKCRVWSWFEWSSLPSPLFVPLQNLKNKGFVLPSEGWSV